MNLYQDKKAEYFAQARTDLAALIQEFSKLKVLEIGAGSGATLKFLKAQNIAAEAHGIELMSLSDSFQEDEAMDSFTIGSIEDMSVDLPENYFDVIIFADVLEHLVDPWAVLEKVKKHLTPKGYVLVSIPNFREFATLYKVIVNADFRYADWGVLDKTHLRFFCKKNIQQLLEDGGFRIKKMHPNYMINPQGKKKKWLNRLTLGVFEDFLATQYLILAQNT